MTSILCTASWSPSLTIQPALNTIVLSLFHNRMSQSRYSEVNVNLFFEHWLLVICITATNGSPRSITIWVWIWLTWLGTFCLSSNFSFCLSSYYWTQFFHPVMFQGNLWRVTRWRIYFLVNDCSSFHPNNFRDTIRWECFVKNDSVRSSLTELQSFLQSKIDVDPIHRILMFLPPFLLVQSKTQCIQVDRIRILMVFVREIHKQKEYCLFGAQNFVQPVSIQTWWWNVNWKHIRRDECTWRNRPQ